MTPAGFAYFTIPFSGISSMTPVLFCRRASRSTPMILKRLELRPSGSPSPLSCTLIATMRLKVFSFAVAQPSAWHKPVDARLVVAGNGAHGRARARDHFIDERRVRVAVAVGS